MSRGLRGVPSNPTEWAAEMIQLGLFGHTLHDTNVQFQSASEVDYRQFLLLRAVRVIQDQNQPFNPLPHGLGLFVGQAAINLQQYPSLQQYLSSFPPNTIQEGAFSVVKREQERCAQNPGPAKDEQIVNAAAVYFLMSLSRPFLPSQEWTMERKKFVAVFGPNHYTAMTDGGLEDDRLGIVHAIVETKKTDRRHDGRRVRMQETAQLVAWIVTRAQNPAHMARTRNR